MKLSFSLATLLLVVLASALATRIWQATRPIDHFEVDIAGVLASKLPPNTELRILRNPDHDRRIDCRVGVADLPVELTADYSFSGCVAEFWSTDATGLEQRLFSIAVDSATSESSH